MWPIFATTSMHCARNGLRCCCCNFGAKFSVGLEAVSNMAADNRCATWKSNEGLKTRLENLISQGCTRAETLDYLQQDFPEYPWSSRSHDRRLRYFNI